VQLTAHADAFCERLIGTVHRECLDFVIPLTERHLCRMLAEWVAHYNRRPHASLGPGIPDPSSFAEPQLNGHELPRGYQVATRSILSSLHHEYRLDQLRPDFLRTTAAR